LGQTTAGRPLNWMTKPWLMVLALAGSWKICQATAADFKFGTRTLTVPDGFEVELVAAPPLVERPIAADFDEQGRLYVADSSGSNDPPEKQLKDRPHRIVRLEDTHGDGKFDTRVVFADKMMFPEGVLWRDGSLYVGAPPSIWKLTDTDGDGVADRREEWMQGKTLTGCANDLHGPYAGPDGWIYWCKGAFAQQTYERPGRAPFTTRAAHIFRCRPDGTGIEPVMTGGMDNPVGVAFTETGERILSATFLQEPGGGKRDGLIHAIYGGVYGKIHDVIEEHPRTGEVMPVLDHLGPAAPCGLICYDSDQFGHDYRGNLFSCLFNLHKIVRHMLVPDGATYKTVDSDFLTCDDPDFHPTAVIEDADGSLIILNTGGWYKLCCPTSQLAKPDVLGEIYRVRRKGAHHVTDPRGLLVRWNNLSSRELAKLLNDPRSAVRKRAIHQLAKHGTNSITSLAAVIRDSGSVEARRNALWALAQIDSPNARKAVRDALKDKDSTIRHVAVQSISLWRDPQAVSALEPLLHDEDLQVRRCAAEALGGIGNPESISRLFAVVAELDPTSAELGDSARVLEHAVIFALIEIADLSATRAELASRNPRVRRAALMAFDQMPGGRLPPGAVVPLLGSTNRVLKDTANWIVQRHTDWGDALVGYFRDRLTSPNLSESEITDLQGQLAPQTGNAGIQELLSAALLDSKMPSASRLLVLRTMSRATPNEIPPMWQSAVAATLRSEDAGLQPAALATARAFRQSKSHILELTAALKQIAGKDGVAAETRLQALAATPTLDQISTELFTFLLRNIDSSQPWPIRNDATATLVRAKLDRAQLLALSDALRAAGPAELTKLLSAFENCSDETIGMSLIENLKAAKAVTSLRPEVLNAKIAKFPNAVQQQAGELMGRLNADAGKQQEHLDKLMEQLPKGDVRRGQAIFNNPKVACSSCHAIGYRGGHVGPDLTNVGTIRTERDLLESIIYPSASFVRSYEPMVVRTRSGEDFTGVLREDSAEQVVLVTGPETEMRIARSEVEEMHQGTVSLMPQGLDSQLTPQELADLVAFLKNTKWGAK
jgi:putative membrane-bound dehydrogenase-like protein